MRFTECPCNIPIQCHLQDQSLIVGRKAIVGNSVTFNTEKRCFLLDPLTKQLWQVYPYSTSSQLPLDGWERSQFDLYPVTHE